MVEWSVGKVKQIARGVVYGTVLTAIGRIFSPIFRGLEAMAFGSNPSEFGGARETLGLLDMPVVFARLLGETTGDIITLLFGVAVSLVNAIAIRTPGPWDGIVFTLLLVVLAVAVYRLIVLLVSAVPVVGSPLSRLLDRD